MKQLKHTASNLNDDQLNGWRTIRRVVPYLWPDGQSWVKRRVVLALATLFVAKLIAVGTPLFYKGAVDALAGDGSENAMFLALGAVGLTIAYGLARLMNVGFQQLRDVIFAAVGQRALRQLALETFTHIHRLSMRYHITRKTGGLSRIIERGVKGVEFLLRFLLFSIGPLVLELLMISVILFFLFDVWYLAVVVLTIALYVWFTFAVTEWRVKIRKEMNDQDTDANQKAIDSLLNFETVKYFGAEAARRNAMTIDGEIRRCRAQNLLHARVFEFRSVDPDYRRFGDCHGDGCNRRTKRGLDRRGFCDGQCLHDPDHHAAEFPRDGLPRNSTGVGRYG